MTLSDDDVERLARASSEAVLKLTTISLLTGLVLGGIVGYLIGRI